MISVVIDASMAHLCTTMKLPSEGLFSGLCQQILLLEVVRISEQDFALISVMALIVQRFLSKKDANKESPATVAIRGHLQLIAKRFNCHAERESLQSTLQILESNSVDCSFEENVLDSVSSVQIGLAQSLCSVLPSIPIYAAILTLKKIANLVLGLSRDPKSIPKSLHFATIPLRAKSLLKYNVETPTMVSNGFLVSILDLCQGTPFEDLSPLLNASSLVADCAAMWIFAQAILSSKTDDITIAIQANLDEFNDSLALALAQAIKFCHKHGKMVDTPTFFSAKLPSVPYERLFILEQLAIKDLALYEGVYQTLNDSDFAEYLRSASRFLPHGKNTGLLEIEGMQRLIEESLLANMKWDINDVPHSFDPSSADDRLFVDLRRVLQSGCTFKNDIIIDRPLHKFAEIVVHTKLGIISIESLDKFAMQTYWSVKDDLLSKLKLAKALGSLSGQFSQSPNLNLIAKLCRSDVLWTLGAYDQALLSLEPSRPVKDQGLLPLKAKGASEATVCVLLRAAKWSWKLRCRTADEIRQNYLSSLPSIEQIPTDLRSKAHHTLAKFYDDQFERIRSSETLKAKRKLVQRAQKELDAMSHFLQVAKPKDSVAYEKNRQLPRTRCYKILVRLNEFWRNAMITPQRPLTITWEQSFLAPSTIW